MTAAPGDTAQWSLPDSDICTAARLLVHDVAPPFIVNHCVRSYLFGRELAAAQRLGADGEDDEDLFLTCLLHDLGISDHADGVQRFEVDGADAAARFLREHGHPDRRIVPIWQSIALHTSVGIAERFGSLQAVSYHGISLDVHGAGKDLLPEGFADRVHAAWPRHDLGSAIADAIARGTRADPRKAPPFSLPGHLHQLINGEGVTFADLVAGAPWGDRPISRPEPARS